ncbi:LuxR C-terminal-related transcriptional regulator [Zhongshania sp.]|jgi:ATP/maltotriose-dependent transcriptional regulator MalT|uniref:LuxR C-terminal-related transcriptional regulator n=1 Tax=Zhongshania sp. TaxID=1971902 RepID=UPI0039E2D03A
MFENNKDSPAVDTARSIFSQFQILEAKLKPPYLRAQAFARESLTQGVEAEAAATRLLTLIAPAGSGKSTLMAELYNGALRSGRHCCWLSLDVDDNESAIFSKYFIACTYGVDIKSAERELAFLKYSSIRDCSALFDTLLARIISIGTEITIFVDDFQYISNSEIIRFWNRLILHAPPTMCVVIAGRNRLPLDLSRRQISGMLTEITQNDLNLTASEIQRYLHQAHDIPCEIKSAEILHHSTEGWVAGVQLAALAISSSNTPAADFIEGFTGKDKSLTEYLLQTVLSELPTDVRAFLLSSSPLIRFSAVLCDHINEADNGHQIIEYLDKNNIFVVSEDRDGIWYRYHHLFEDFLRSELKKQNPLQYNKICIRAAQWWESQDLLTESIQYYLTAHNFDKAADLITARAPDIALLRGDHYTILDWMRRLPEKYHTSQPQLLLNHAWSCAFSRDPERSIELCHKALAGLEDATLFDWDLDKATIETCYWQAKTTEVIATVVSDELIKSAGKCKQILDTIPKTELFDISSIYNCLAYSMLGQREYVKSAHYAAEGYKFSIKSGSNYGSVWAEFLGGLANVEMGKLRAASENASKASHKAGPASDNNISLCAMADFIRSEINVQKCNFNVSTGSSGLGRSFISLYGPVEPLLAAIRNEARQLVWGGKFGLAWEVLHHGQEIALSTNQGRLHFGLVAEEIELQIWSGQVAEAKETLTRTHFFTFDTSDLSTELIPAIEDTTQLILARVLLADNQAEKALKIIVRLINATRIKNDSRIRLLRTLATMKAVALWNNNQKKEGVRELDKVINDAAQEDHAYPILVSGRQLLPILEEIQSRHHQGLDSAELKVKNNFVNRLLLLLNGEAAEPVVDLKTVNVTGRYELTGREISILKLIGAGMANSEIAGELVISIATVKWHLHNIYQKIDVKSRTAAAAYARKISLI